MTFGAMENYTQWMLWTIETTQDGNELKRTIDTNGRFVNAHDPAYFLDYATASRYAAGVRYGGLAFVLTRNDPFFFVDLDDCLQSGAWGPDALAICGMFPGAFMEVSYSQTGLHIVGSWDNIVPHRCQCDDPHFELYTHSRFIALTGINATGDSGTIHTGAVHHLISTYLEKPVAEVPEGESGPVPGWYGPTDDAVLIETALRSHGVGSTLLGKCSFRDLWEFNVDAFERAYPDDHGGRRYDESRVDAALAQHLAFWTGKDRERIIRLMWMSPLVREKWDRPDYIPRTVDTAISLQKEVLGSLPKLKARSDKQKEYAETLRDNVLKCATPDQVAVLTARTGPVTSANFWVNAPGKSVEELVESVTPPTATCERLDSNIQMVTGYQYMTVDAQLAYFAGCVYVQEVHKIFIPSGDMLKPEQFNATYGGYVFQLDDLGDKTTRKAWEAFTESQAVRFPKVNGTYFRPLLPAGSFTEADGRIYVNTYVPISTPRRQGDPSPFLRHLEKLLPDTRDREIILSYMAACVQFKGKKFHWCPLIQGTEGNGKTLLTRCVAFALGERYVHMPPAQEIAEKFNEWLFCKLLIGIEDVYVPESKKEVMEVLKPMVTNERLSMRAMHQSQVMGDNVANFILNSNYKDAIRKHEGDRRFAIFYTAQQTRNDMLAAGMLHGYFPALYAWLEHDGYAIVSDYLHTYPIKEHYNPAGAADREPGTSSTSEAIRAGLGSVEQEILEATEEGQQGFAGGWISSVALDKLLTRLRAGRMISPNKRRDVLRTIGYDWHPALPNGRANSMSVIDDMKKPKLFVKAGHPDADIKDAGEAFKAYERAQTGRG
jgi:hypothetical protein